MKENAICRRPGSSNKLYAHDGQQKRPTMGCCTSGVDVKTRF